MSDVTTDLDAVVIGGGFYGCAIAIYLVKKQRFKRVALVESEPALLRRASYNNQARIHNGCHYPSSFTTAYRSRTILPKFVRDWPGAVKKDWLNMDSSQLRQQRAEQRFQQPFAALPITSRWLAFDTKSERYAVTGSDPQLIIDIASLDLAGRDAGLLIFDFFCSRQRAEPRMQVFWWADGKTGTGERYSLHFTAGQGALIVPLDASSYWLNAARVERIRIDLNNATACAAIDIKNIALYQRR